MRVLFILDSHRYHVRDDLVLDTPMQDAEHFHDDGKVVNILLQVIEYLFESGVVAHHVDVLAFEDFHDELHMLFFGLLEIIVGRFNQAVLKFIFALAGSNFTFEFVECAEHF